MFCKYNGLGVLNGLNLSGLYNLFNDSNMPNRLNKLNGALMCDRMISISGTCPGGRALGARRPRHPLACKVAHSHNVGRCPAMVSGRGRYRVICGAGLAACKSTCKWIFWMKSIRDSNHMRSNNTPYYHISRREIIVWLHRKSNVLAGSIQLSPIIKILIVW